MVKNIQDLYVQLKTLLYDQYMAMFKPLMKQNKRSIGLSVVYSEQERYSKHYLGAGVGITKQIG